MVPAPFIVAVFLVTVLSVLNLIPYFLSFLVPKPRAPNPKEKTYITSQPSGRRSSFRSLPCWYDTWLKQRKAAEDNHGHPYRHTGTIEEPELEMSVVIPAYNEEKRIEAMLEEAISFLDAEYGRVPELNEKSPVYEQCKEPSLKGMGGYEILIVNDGSKDRTVDVALAFSQKHELHDILRVCTLNKNRGKGGAVTHGLRHVRGAYALFADADGASQFSDLRKLVEGCKEVADVSGRAISVGNRTHLIGSDAVVKRSALRNILMHSFHLLLRFLTPPATSRIQDTQCGFKLLTRSALPYIIPYMHTEGWIFDVEILMLAEDAPPVDMEGTAETESGIRVKEVFISWKEVSGSKLNVIRDCMGMAYGLALLRASWIFGLYKRR